ncbi:unnamed protein product, partial [Schistosoma mattheei]
RKKKCIRFISEAEPEEFSNGTTTQQPQTGTHHSSTHHLARQRLANFIDPFIRPAHSSQSNISSQSSKFHTFPSSFLCSSINFNNNVTNERTFTSSSSSLADFSLRLNQPHHAIPGCYTGKSSAFISPSLSSRSNHPMLDLSTSPFPLKNSYHHLNNSTSEELNFKLTSSSPRTPSSSSSSSSVLFSPSRLNSHTIGQCLSNCNESRLPTTANNNTE